MGELDTSLDVRPPVVRIAPSDIARRQIATWNGIQTDAVEVVRREPFECEYRAPSHLLIMSERGERDDGETLIEGLPKSTLHEFGHKLSLVPGGHRFRGWQKPRTLTRGTFFYIDPRGPLLDPELRFAETEFKPRLFFFDRDLWETALKLKTQAQDPDPGHRAHAEALGTVLAYELLRFNNQAAPAQQFVHGGLAGRQKKDVAQYIEEHLAEDISLAALAEVARLSPFHFSRAFKQSFGLPPHRYLMSRRVDKAKTLLAKPATSVTQIKRAGLTPTEYRRSLD